MNIIPLNKLIEGHAYQGMGRNFNIAIWTGANFAGLRHKFGDKFIDHEDYHGDSNGTFKPIKDLSLGVERYGTP